MRQKTTNADVREVSQKVDGIHDGVERNGAMLAELRSIVIEMRDGRPQEFRVHPDDPA